MRLSSSTTSKQVNTREASARRSRMYRPQCNPLEDRCLLSVTLRDSGPTDPLVGSPVTWTATADDHGESPVYQFSVGPAGGKSQVVRDFSTSDSFTWNPMREGTYEVRVIVKDSFAATPGESAVATYTAGSRVRAQRGHQPHAQSPGRAVQRPPSPGRSMRVEFRPAGPDQPWSTTSPLPIVPGESTNFLVAGMLPETTYEMRHVLDNGTKSSPLTFTTGALPTDLTFPTFTRSKGLTPALTRPRTWSSTSGSIPRPTPSIPWRRTGTGNIVWYYDPVANNFPSYAPSLVPGGTVLLLGNAETRPG